MEKEKNNILTIVIYYNDGAVGILSIPLDKKLVNFNTVTKEEIHIFYGDEHYVFVVADTRGFEFFYNGYIKDSVEFSGFGIALCEMLKPFQYFSEDNQ